MYFFRARHLVLIYTPKEAHSRIFATAGGQYIRVKNTGPQKFVFWGGQLVHNAVKCQKLEPRVLNRFGTIRQPI